MYATVLSVTGAAVALAALGAALWQGHLLRRQVGHAELVSSAQFYQNITVQWIEFDKFCIDRPHLWAYFHGDKPPPEHEKDHTELICMASAIANLAEICVNSKTVLGPYSGDWERYFHFVYVRGPFFRDFWRKYKVLWSEDVNKVFTMPIPGFDPPPEVELDTDGRQLSRRSTADK